MVGVCVLLSGMLGTSSMSCKSSPPEPTRTPEPAQTAKLSVQPPSIAAHAAAITAQAKDKDITFVGAGDIAVCDTPFDEATAKLVGKYDGPVFLLGDNAYETGSRSDYTKCFAPSWGNFKERMFPVPGNHEYMTGATPYFDYFGEAAGERGKGWYSFDLGSWHVVAINSECKAIGGCAPGSPQYEWLKRDLAEHPATCTLAYWHRPRFSSGRHGSDTSLGDLWSLLVSAGTEFVMSGHDHHYERFAPMNATGERDVAKGMRQFVIGTGGRNLYPIDPNPLPTTELRDNQTYGIMKLSLRKEGYGWEFVPVEGGTFKDSGEERCH
jgi:hypothetical protein